MTRLLILKIPNIDLHIYVFVVCSAGSELDAHLPCFLWTHLNQVRGTKWCFQADYLK